MHILTIRGGAVAFARDRAQTFIVHETLFRKGDSCHRNDQEDYGDSETERGSSHQLHGSILPRQGEGRIPSIFSKVPIDQLSGIEKGLHPC